LTDPERSRETSAAEKREEHAERIAKAYRKRRAELEAGEASGGRALIRARIRVVDGFLKEARAGRFVFLSDEPVESGGGGTAPFPLHYFVAGVGF
jgi:hypothetical protein